MLEDRLVTEDDTGVDGELNAEVEDVGGADEDTLPDGGVVEDVEGDAGVDLLTTCE